MLRILTSEWLKTKRTAIRYVTFYLPAIYSLCAVLYLNTRPNSTQEFAFEGFFTIWAIFIIPVGVGVLAAYVVQEEESGNFSGYLSTGVSRTTLYLGKYFLLLFCLTIAMLTGMIIFCILMKYTVMAELNIGIFICAAVLMIIGTLPILAIHLWLSFAMGVGASIGISIGGVLLAAILGSTVLGSKVWPFIPWTWPVKLGLLPGTYFLKIAGIIKEADIIQIQNTLFIGSGAATISSILILLCGLFWFHKWEGH